MTIPAHIDCALLTGDLNRWGWFDKRIELMCGFSQGYIARLKKNPNAKMSYDRAARLYNLWCAEYDRRLAPSKLSGIKG